MKTSLFYMVDLNCNYCQKYLIWSCFTSPTCHSASISNRFTVFENVNNSCFEIYWDRLFRHWQQGATHIAKVGECCKQWSHSLSKILGRTTSAAYHWSWKKKITFKNRRAGHDEMCETLQQSFPPLRDSGGFTLFRAFTGGQNRPLSQLQCNWYSVEDLKREISSAACI